MIVFFFSKKQKYIFFMTYISFKEKSYFSFIHPKGVKTFDHLKLLYHLIVTQIYVLLNNKELFVSFIKNKNI